MSAPYRPVMLDESAQLLNMSYRLRYQSFCLEKLFFSKDQFPTELESDAFDRTSVHVGAVNAYDELVGTARVVKPSSAGLPLLRHCTLFPHDTTLSDPSNTVVELSRVCINRRLTQRAMSMAGHDGPAAPGLPAPARANGQGYDDPFTALVKGVYQVTKRLRVTHWMIAVEKGLQRRLMRYGLPFRLAGPEADYYGPVAPYVLSIAELDEIIRSGEYPFLNDFPVGSTTEYRPATLSQQHQVSAN